MSNPFEPLPSAEKLAGAREDANRNVPERNGPIRVLIVASHPIQYFAPLFRRYEVASHVDLHVAYCSLRGAEVGRDPDFGVDVAWDVPLLEGYAWTQIPNVSRRPRIDAFLGCINPGLWSFIRAGEYDLVICH